MKAVVLIDTNEVPRGIGRPCVIIVDCPAYDRNTGNYYRDVHIPAMDAAMEKMKEWRMYYAPLRVDVYPVEEESECVANT